MPEDAQTIFNAILVNDQNGKATDVTTRELYYDGVALANTW